MQATPHAEFDERPILAIDTSSAQGGLALFDGQTISLRSWPAARSHTTTVLSEIHHMLDAAGLGVRDLAAVAIAAGPGAFTGLRVGFGVAKGFHLATGVPLIGVSTLEATALPFAICDRPIVAAIAAGRGRLVWAHFTPGSEGLSETRSPRNGAVAELVAELRSIGGCIVTGELEEDQAKLVAGVDDVLVPARALRTRQPAAIADIGWQRWSAGIVDDPVDLEPVYLSR